jgi:hypothetical protein
MKFDKSKVFTALNADELKIGSKVILADSIAVLKSKVVSENDICESRKLESNICELRKIEVEAEPYRFVSSGKVRYMLCYLVSEPEEKLLKWTDLKIGDVIKLKDNKRKVQVIGIDEDGSDYHIYACGNWMRDTDLANWEKV